MKKVHFAIFLVLCISFVGCKKQTEDILNSTGDSQDISDNTSALVSWDQLPSSFKNAKRMEKTNGTSSTDAALRSVTSIMETYGPYGSFKGLTFDIVPPDAGSSIAGIGVATVGGNKISGLSVYYRTANGAVVYDGTGNLTNVRIHQFAADEYLMGVTGRSGSLLDQLTLITNKIQITFGGTGGTPFLNVAPKGAQILGFRGRSDANINQIIFEVHCKPWTLLTGSGAKDIAVALDGTGYMVNTNGVLYKLTPFTTSTWIQMAGSAGKSIAANANRVCLVNTAGNIYELFGSTWRQLAGSGARDVAINADGKIWMVNSNGSIYRYNETSWQKMPGSDAVRISAGAGQVWMINSVGNIYRFNGTSWTQTVGSAGRDIAVGNDGTVWLTNTTGNIYSWTGSVWKEICGSAGYTLAANNRKVFMVNTTGRMYKLTY